MAKSAVALRDDIRLSEFDLALLNAMQINPRATYGFLAEALNSSAKIVARHWERLVQAGVAWVTAYANTGDSCAAWVEISCEPSKARELAARLAQDPHAVTIVHVTGHMDLVCVVLASDFGQLSRYLRGLEDLPGVRHTVSHPFAGSYYMEATSWRLSSLDSDQKSAVEAKDKHRPAERSLNETERTMRIDVRPIALALAENGRLSLQALSDELGITFAAARWRLNRLLESKRLKIRCEIASAYRGQPITALVWARGPSDEALLDPLLEHISGYPGLRTCAVTASRHSNLVLSVSLQTLEGVRKMQSDLTAAHPDLRILGVSLVLEPVKLAGHLQDPSGRRIGTVPMDIWQPVRTTD